MTTLRQAAQAVVERWDATRYVMQDEMSALREALAAPEQEPVAWMHPSRDPHLVSHSAYTYGSASIPLYAAPVNVVALTQERDELRAQYSDALGQISHIDAKRDALMQAAKLALDALVLLNGDAHLAMMSDDGPAGTYANKVFHKTCLSLAALKKAGVAG